MKLTNRIVKNGLCLGCGLCEAIYGKENVSMDLSSNGFYLPQFKQFVKEKTDIIYKICPSINVINDIKFNSKNRVWGNVVSCSSSFSSNNEVRTIASSGGAISQIAIYLLENNKVDGILQVGSDELDYQKNELRISKTRGDILQCAKSRYAPASMFNNFFDILDKNEDKYCFIGKPCDISAIKNILNIYPKYKKRFVLLVSIMCAGMPSYNATSKVIRSFSDVKYPIRSLIYRGDGWPGYFSFVDSKGELYKMGYNDSWGRVLGKDIHFRCKICPDGIGLQADLVVGDAWETKDGYPDFTEKEGESLLVTRTDRAFSLIKQMEQEGIIVSKKIEVNRLKYIQPYQYNRRRIVGARVLATMMVKLILFRFCNVKLFHNLFLSPLHWSVREFLGSAKRAIKL